MKDKIFMILLGIIAVNLTIQTVKDVGIFPTAYAQSGVQMIAICNANGRSCAEIGGDRISGAALKVETKAGF